ncbi:MAG: aminotransferase class III-fold pyridoxal phosphate-dependent enzyme [Candidatus Micrarchaeaceae archaeon]
MKTVLSKRAKDIIARDKRIFLTTTREPFYFIPQRGEGDFAYDIDNRKFIDFTSFISVYNLGVNANAKIRGAIKKQVDTLMHAAFTDFYGEMPLKFGEQLMKFMPKGFGKLFLSNSGTEANEAAIKFAKIYTGRSYILGFYNSFHGRTGGSLGVTASKYIQRENFGPFPNDLHAPYPYCYRCPFNEKYPGCGFACIDYIRKYPLAKEASPKEVSAIMFEPIQGEGGYIVPPLDYFKELKRLADENGMLMIADEVQSGYMRTGKFLALDNFGVTADIYTMAKSLGGGLPIGATITSNALGDIPYGKHANTFGGNFAVAAGGYEALKQIWAKKDRLSKEIVEKGKYIMKRLERMKEDYEIIGDVRGIGLMIGVEFVKDKKSKEPAPDDRDRIQLECFDNGLLLLPSGESTIRIIPPLTVKKSTVDAGLDIFEDAVKKVSKKQ